MELEAFLVGNMKLMLIARNKYIGDEPNQVDFETMLEEMESQSDIIVKLRLLKFRFWGHQLNLVNYTIEECLKTMGNLDRRIQQIENDNQNSKSK